MCGAEEDVGLRAFSVQGLGFRCRVKGLGFKGLGFRGLGFIRCRV